jgi:integrase
LRNWEQTDGGFQCNFSILRKLEVAKTHPHSQQLNLRLSKQHFEIQRAVLTLEDDFSIEALQEKLGGKVKPKVMSFKLFAESLITQMYAVNRAGNAIVYQTAVNRFLDFCAKPTIQFKEITYTLLDQFAHHLALEGLRQNSIANYFRSLRAIYNKAIKAKVIDRSAYPFLDLKIKSEKTTKRAVLRKDIASLEQLDLSADKASEKALKCFLLSFYLIGLSFTDLAYLTKKNIQDGRVVYRRRKTHKNYSIKLYPKAAVILNELYQDGNKYLLPILPNDVIEDSLKAKQLIHQWIKTTNKYLKRLGMEVGIEAS